MAYSNLIHFDNCSFNPDEIRCMYYSDSTHKTHISLEGNSMTMVVVNCTILEVRKRIEEHTKKIIMEKEQASLQSKKELESYFGILVDQLMEDKNGQKTN